MLRSIFKYFKSYFLYGLFIIVPVAATIFIVYLAFQLLLTPFNRLFGAEISPLLGILVSVLFIVGIGFISRNVIGQLVLDLFDVLVSKVPLINRIYDSSKHLIDVFSSQKREEMKPVLVEYPKEGMWVIGFLTFTSLDTLGSSVDSFAEKVSIFIPTTPNPTSGYLVFVDKAKISPLDIGFEEAIKTLVSAGVISPK